MGERLSGPAAGEWSFPKPPSSTVAAAASLSPREAARSTKSSRLARCALQPKLTRFSAQRTRARTLQARSLLATRTQAHVLLARCFRLRRLLSLASRAADFFGLGTPRALAVAGLAWQPAGCWLACGDVALAGCEASAFVRSFWSHSHCARRRLPPVSSSSSTTSLLADHSAEPRSGGDDIVIDGCRGIFCCSRAAHFFRPGLGGHTPVSPPWTGGDSRSVTRTVPRSAHALEVDDCMPGWVQSHSLNRFSGLQWSSGLHIVFWTWPAGCVVHQSGGKGYPNHRFQLRRMPAQGELSSGAQQAPE